MCSNSFPLYISINVSHWKPNSFAFELKILIRIYWGVFRAYCWIKQSRNLHLPEISLASNIFIICLGLIFPLLLVSALLNCSSNFLFRSASRLFRAILSMMMIRWLKLQNVQWYRYVFVSYKKIFLSIIIYKSQQNKILFAWHVCLQKNGHVEFPHTFPQMYN